MDCIFLEQTCELRTFFYPYRPGSHSLSLGHPTFSFLLISLFWIWTFLNFLILTRVMSALQGTLARKFVSFSLSCLSVFPLHCVLVWNYAARCPSNRGNYFLTYITFSFIMIKSFCKFPYRRLYRIGIDFSYFLNNVCWFLKNAMRHILNCFVRCWWCFHSLFWYTKYSQFFGCL